ncbi:hypothetical protein MKX03_030358 [Papaver bracteatum]|nr:hypothetical protein MKX03_030358 [Papaver bracteatum]
MFKSVCRTSSQFYFKTVNYCAIGNRRVCIPVSTIKTSRRLTSGFTGRVKSSINIKKMSVSSSSSVVEQTVSENGFEPVELLNATNDHFDGVIIDMNKPMDSDIFVSSLRTSISHWRQQGKKGVWIKLPIQLVNLVEAAVKEGFWYHHAEPNYLMLVYWIPETANTLPINATHRVGIGAFVMNDKREILVVQENSGIFKGTGVWKFPTGVINEGEDISVGAVREVKEEMGIDTEFVEVLAFMQSHQSFFHKSDLFFVCMLRPLSFDIQKQDLEIEAAEWMPIENFMAQPLAKKEGLLKSMIDIGLAKIDKGYTGFSSVPTTLSFSNQQSCLYVNSCDLFRQNL